MTTKISNDEAPYVMARIAERLMEKELILVMATMEEYEASGIYTIKVTYHKR